VSLREQTYGSACVFKVLALTQILSVANY